MVQRTDGVNKLYREILESDDYGLSSHVRYCLDNDLAIDFICKIVGTTFTDGQQIMQYLLNKAKKEDILLYVVREKNNQYDRNALRVDIGVTWSDKRYHLGYIPRGVARKVAENGEIELKIKDFYIATLNNLYGMTIKYYFE